MKLLYWKAFFTIALSLMAVIAEAAGIFSHTVLNLPYEYRSEQPWSSVINTQQEWEMFYDELIAGNVVDGEPLSAPEIDFDLYQLIAGGLGVRATGGYVLSVERVSDLGDSIYLQVLNSRPGPGCIVTQELTYPTAAVLIRKTGKPMRFFVANLVQECEP